MGMWLAIGVVVAVGLVLGFRRLAKRSAFAGRTPVPLEDLYAPVREQVSFEVFRDVWTTLGKAYSIDPQLLRPADAFSTLNRMDSWTLGKGADDIGGWLQKRGLGNPPPLQTVLEFAAWVQKSTAH